jgi:hypothetical protein
MGIRTSETRYDDLTGEPGEDIEKFEFVLDGILYSMDACEQTRSMFRDRVHEFTSVAKSRVLGPGVHSSEIREWAKTAGFTVSENGRLPDKVISAYRDAHP